MEVKRAVNSFTTQAALDKLEHLAIWIGNAVLGDVAFYLGTAVGLAKSVWGQVKGLYTLPRMFVLAAQYEIETEASRRHWPSWAVRGAIGGVEAGFGLSALTIGATGIEEKQADDEVRAIIQEVKSLTDSGPSGAWAQLKKIAGNKWAAVEAEWDRYKLLVSSGNPSKMYDAGVIYGQFLGELITTILLIISIAGTAVRVAKLAASGARALAELAGLVTAAEGTEIGLAARTLSDANAELQAARAAGDVQRAARAERAVAGAARDLQQKAETAQKLVREATPNLGKQAQALEKAKAAEGGGDAAGGSAAEEPAAAQRTSGPKSEKPANEPSEEKTPKAVPRTEVRNGYKYTFDQQQRVSNIEGDLTSNPGQGRNPSAQLGAGGSDRLPTDEGGHFVGRRFDGPTDDFNHFAQDANFNRSAYKKLENSWQKALDNGSDVHVNITPNYPEGSLRPESLDIDYTVDGVPYHRSFINQPGG